MEKSKFSIVRQRLYQIVNGVKTLGYICRALTNGTMKLDDLAEEASLNTSAHKAEVKMNLELALDAAKRGLQNGKIIDLGPLGKIYPTVRSKWKTDPEDLKLEDLHTNVNYKPSEEILSGVHGATLVWASKKDKDKQTTEEAAGDSENTEHQTVDTSTGTVDTSTGSNNSGGDDIPAGNG